MEGITSAAEAVGATVTYAIGADTSKWSPLLDRLLRLPGGTVDDKAAFRMDFYDKE